MVVRGRLPYTRIPGSRRIAVSGGSRVTRWLMGRGYLEGRRVLVVEFPKSGGTWLARLIGTALEWPFLDDWFLPPANNCVLRGHQLPRPGVEQQVYLIRDPRDVFISLFHHRVTHWAENVRYREAWNDTGLAALDAMQLRSQMVDFLRFEQAFAGAGGSAVPTNWSAHVAAWYDARDSAPRSSLVSYEALRADPAAELRRVITDLTAVDPGAEIVAATAAAHDFDLRRGAATSTSSRSFLRSGRAGGWREHLTREAGRTLHEQHGQVMIRAGYVDSEEWWYDLPEE